MAGPTVEKAKITNLDTNAEVVCHFNPAEFSISKTAGWKPKKSMGSDTPQWVYSGGEAQSLSVSFLFDTTDHGGERDVRDEYQELVKMVMVDEGTIDPKTGFGEPPMCRFQWGSFLAFNAVISKVNQKFSYFAPNGTPVRAEVTVTFEQAGEETRGQNPTTRTEARKTWIVREGQTLDWIAFQEYGDVAQWRHIADTNGLMDPKELRPGQILKLVPLP